MNILGLSAYYHDSAAALVRDGIIVAAAQEERFSRKKHDARFPEGAINSCLSEGGITLADVDEVVFYDKPLVKFERLLETYLTYAPRGFRSFVAAMPVWLKEKLYLKATLKRQLAELGGMTVKELPALLFAEHHQSHAASAFFPSPFEKAAVLCLDGVGEWATTSVWLGDGQSLTPQWELDFPHSLGMLYSAFTYYTGFRVNSGEYKLMGLAPYGNPESEQTNKFKKIILDNLVDIRDDGSLLLNMEYFNYATGLTMCRDSKWETLFDIPRRLPETGFKQEYMNLALAIQQVTEDIVIKMANTAKSLTNADHLVLAGGVALNCVANGKLLRKGIFNDIWIQPAAGDAGGSIGAALVGWHIWKGKNRNHPIGDDSMKGAYLGPEFSNHDILCVIRKYDARFNLYTDFDILCDYVAALLAEGNVVGWFQGKMEYGPRALGNRSILGDPRNPDMQKKLNLKIKYREGFRPFAPSVLEEDIDTYFDLDRPTPYMLLVAPVKESRRNPLPKGYKEMEIYERLYHLRSDIPAITHVDYSARIQFLLEERYLLKHLPSHLPSESRCILC